MHKITDNFKKNRGSTPILTNLVEVHPRNINTKFEANMCSNLRKEVENLFKMIVDENGEYRLQQSYLKKLETRYPGDSPNQIWMTSSQLF